MPSNWVFADDAPFAEDPFSIQPDKSVRWENLKEQLTPGTIVTGRIFIQAPFGVFFDAGIGFPVLINVTEFGTTRPLTFPADYPPLNTVISGMVCGFDDGNRQVRVTRAN